MLLEYNTLRGKFTEPGLRHLAYYCSVLLVRQECPVLDIEKGAGIVAIIVYNEIQHRQKGCDMPAAPHKEGVAQKAPLSLIPAAGQLATRLVHMRDTTGPQKESTDSRHIHKHHLCAGVCDVALGKLCTALSVLVPSKCNVAA